MTGVACLLGAALLPAQTVNLSTNKQLIGEIPGHPLQLNNLPMSMAVSPDGRYVVTVNAGYGSLESNYEQFRSPSKIRSPERSRTFPTTAPS